MARKGQVPISKPDKVLFPHDGFTKRDLADYYSAVADVMLPHVQGRPISMQRFPDGIDGPGFYEKKVPGHFPDWIGTVLVTTADGDQEQVTVEDHATLAYLADQACITPHTWLSRRGSLDHPDALVVDLDPSADDLADLRDAVRATADLLEELGLTAYLKTTGSRGYHVQVPLDASSDHDAVRDVAQRVARLLAARDPERFTTEQRKNKRGARVYVDVARNAYGQTVVPAYAVRPRPGAPVATPITRDELGKVAPDRYSMRSVLRRLAQRRDPWARMADARCSLGTAQSRLREIESSPGG